MNSSSIRANSSYPVKPVSGFWLILAVVASLLSACGSDTMNVKEAEQVTLAYHGEAFTPPPRTIDDVLRQIGNADYGQVDDRCGVCKRPVDASAPLGKKVNWYTQVGLANFRRGNTRVAKEYLHKAVDMAARARKKGRFMDAEASSMMHNRLAQFYAEMGQFRNAVQYLRKGETYYSNLKGRHGKKLRMYYEMTVAYALSGNIGKAKKAWRQARYEYTQLMSKKRPDHPWRPRWEVHYHEATAMLYQAKGELRLAEQEFREAQPWYEEELPRYNTSHLHAAIRSRGLYLVNNLLEQGRVAEAELESRKALARDLEVFGRDTPASASVIMGMANVMMARGRFEDAERLAREVRKILVAIEAKKSSAYYARVMNLLGETKLAQLDHKSALETFEQNRRALHGDKEAEAAFINSNLSYAIALLRSGNIDQAERIARNAYDRRRRALGKDHYSVQEAEAVLTLIDARKNGSGKSLDSLSKLVPAMARNVLDRAADQVEPGAAQIRFRIIVENYLALLAGDRGRNKERDSQLFEASQLAHGQVIQRALSASAARASIKDARLVRLVRQEQDASRKIDAAYNGLVRTLTEATEGESGVDIKAMQSRVDSLRKARESIRDEIAKRYPDYDRLVRPRPTSLAELRQSIRPGEAVIMLYFGETQGYVWAVPNAGPVAFTTIPMTRKAIDEEVARLRKSLDSGAQTLSQIPKFDVATAHALYRQLMAPVSVAWKDAEHIVVIPHGTLSTLPLGVLVTRSPGKVADHSIRFDGYRDVAWLIKKHNLTYLPSVGALTTLRKLPAGSDKRLQFAGFGNPVFGPTEVRATSIAMRGAGIRVRGLRRTKAGDLDESKQASVKLDQLAPLPETASEIMEVAQALHADPGRSVFTGAAATEQQIKTMPLDNRRIIMFATHALVPGDLDGLDQPAIALSSPASTHTNGDGLLTMSEVLGLKLDADWVVLSACNTGAASGKGSEAVSGLGLAFFYAGSRALLVSHWPVETNSARTITTDIFRRQQEQVGIDRAAAISAAMRAMVGKGEYINPDSGKAEFAYAHPMFWAPFTLVGDGRGARL
jgi:CHAT domain-containing protein